MSVFLQHTASFLFNSLLPNDFQASDRDEILLRYRRSGPERASRRESSISRFKYSFCWIIDIRLETRHSHPLVSGFLRLNLRNSFSSVEPNRFVHHRYIDVASAAPKRRVVAPPVAHTTAHNSLVMLILSLVEENLLLLLAVVLPRNPAGV